MELKVRKKYLLSLKKKIHNHCYTLEKRLERFPIKLLNKIRNMEIPEEETVIIREESFPLKEKLPELFTNYKELKNTVKKLQNNKSEFAKLSKKDMIKVIEEMLKIKMYF